MDVVKYHTYYDESVLLKVAIRLDSRSRNWVEWVTDIRPGTCAFCYASHGKIFSAIQPPQIETMTHRNCRCRLEPMVALMAGTVAEAGINGVDFYVFMNGHLPENYLTQDEAQALGWERWRGNLAECLPGAVIGGEVYENRDGRLPDSSGRIWYEADFDYDGGYRNHRRIVFSNDGLMFVTFDHYETFLEVYWIGDFYELYT